MRYCLIISAHPDHDKTDIPEWAAFHQSLVEAGANPAGEGLQGPDTAKTVRVRDGETQVTDGPAHPSVDPCGGYYLIDADSMEQAIEWAAKVPTTSVGSTEIRPIMEIDPEVLAQYEQ